MSRFTKYLEDIANKATAGLYGGVKGAINGDGFFSSWGNAAMDAYNPINTITGLTDLVGITNFDEQKEAQNTVNNTYDELLESSDNTIKDVTDKITGNRDNISELLGGENAIGGFIDAIKGFDPESFKTDISSLADFDYGKDVSAFMDPAADYVINQSVKATQNAMAGQGGLSGGAAAAQLQAVASEKASELYDKAFDRMNQDKSFEYSKVKDLVDAESKNNATALSAQSQLFSNLSKPMEAYIGNLSGSTSDEISAMLAGLANESALKQGKAQAGVDAASQGGWLSQVLSGIPLSDIVKIIGG